MELFAKQEKENRDMDFGNTNVFIKEIKLPPRQPWIEPRPGDVCQVCKREFLDYDGLLNLVCPDCGMVSGGCFT